MVRKKIRTPRIIFRPAIVLCCLPWFVFALTVFSHAEQEGYEHLTAPEVKSMVENDGTLLVHVLTSVEFDMQHIPGSINIPIVEMETTSKLPKKVDTPLIFYCMGKR